MTITQCECTLAGHCKRHDVSKSQHHVKLCQERPEFFHAWEQGRGPGQRWSKSDKDARSNIDATKVMVNGELAEAGRKCWHALFTEVHTLADLEKWESTIPKFGCDCTSFYKEWKASNPVTPDFTDEVDFAWKYRLKKAVNEKLGHKNISFEEAKRQWIPRWNFVSTSDLVQATIELASKLPPIRGVAGVPVSGLLCSSVLSTLLHVPHYEVSAEHGLRLTAHGGRGRTRSVDESLPLFVVDDTVSSGWAISQIRKKLANEPNVIYGSALANPPSIGGLDFYGRECPEPHLLEWNIANTGYVRLLGYPNHSSGSGVMLDFDGVLCPDPAYFDECTDHGRETYLKWMEEVPLGAFVPRMVSIPDIVSYRCEYTREVSEAWLTKHKIKYERLHLWGDASLPAAEQARSRNWLATQWKGKIYRESKCGLFVESCERQSRDIANVSKKPVLCWTTKELLQ